MRHSFIFSSENSPLTGTPVVVLGMGRSGTSVVTRVINLLGLPLCRTDYLGFGANNPEGFWECQPLARFNDRLIDYLGNDSFACSLLDVEWQRSSRVSSLNRQADRLFTRAHSGSVWLWKDPRICLTLPFWRSVWTECPAVVFVYREPLEVALSLHRSYGHNKACSLALWERYSRSALRAAIGMPLIAIDYENLMREPESVIAKLGSQLRELGAPASTDYSGAARCVSLKYGTSRGLNLRLEADADVTDKQRSLFAQIRSLPPISAAFSTPDLPAESVSTTELLRALGSNYGHGRRLRVAGREVVPAFRQSARSLRSATYQKLMKRRGQG